MSKLALLAVTSLVLGGCITERESRREEAVLEAPPPPPPAPEERPAVQPDYTARDDRYDDRYDDEDDAPPPVERDVDTEVFYERLSPYGHWTFVAPYGRVWIPAVTFGWRPYYFGRWVLTDWGWTFVSDDPWGWAAYHYGRWNWGIGVGWYWIPGRVWGPAWVNWRYGGGYVTWCPMGPSGVYFGYGHPAWVAVREQHFTRPISTVAVPTRATAHVVTSAQPLSGPHATVARNGQFGPPVARVKSATGQEIRPVAVAGLIGGPRVRDRLDNRTQAGASRDVLRSPASPRARTDAPAPRVRTGEGDRGYRTGGDSVERAPRPRGDDGARAPDVERAPRPRGGGDTGSAPRPRGGGDTGTAPRPRDDGGAQPAPKTRGGGGESRPRGGSASRPPASSGAAPHAKGGGKPHKKD